jgi:hypothetical protein
MAKGRFVFLQVRVIGALPHFAAPSQRSALGLSVQCPSRKLADCDDTGQAQRIFEIVAGLAYRPSGVRTPIQASRTC